jgi:hypothetical protein
MLCMYYKCLEISVRTSNPECYLQVVFWIEEVEHWMTDLSKHFTEYLSCMRPLKIGSFISFCVWSVRG